MHRQLRAVFALLAVLAGGYVEANAATRCRGAPMSLIPEPVAADNADAVEDGIEHGETDRIGRIVIPVSVNGSGPYRFIVDTGANRSAISRTLAQQLDIRSAASGDVHTIHEVATTPLADVQTLEFARTVHSPVQVPVIEGPVLAGEDGLLGADALVNRRLILDFARQCVEVADATNARRLNGWTSLRGEVRFGSLVLIEGAVRNRRINVLLDTGSGSTLANAALVRALSGVAVTQQAGDEAPGRAQLIRAFTAGAPIVLDTRLLIPELRLGDISIENVGAYVEDFHIFDVWELQDEPTLLIGMDVLSKAQALAINYGSGVVQFQIPLPRRTGSLLRGVENGALGVYERLDRPNTTPTR